MCKILVRTSTFRFTKFLSVVLNDITQVSSPSKYTDRAFFPGCELSDTRPTIPLSRRVIYRL